MSFAYSNDIEKAFKDKLGDICTRHRKLELEKNEPKLSERLGVKKIIFDYIKAQNRVVYGGYAYHLLITKKSSTDFIYNDLDFPDVEFYTADVIGDVKSICNELHESGYKFVMAEEGLHPTTFKISVNTENYCDITFVPLRLLSTIRTIVIKGIRVACPSHIYIDVYKVYSYPMNNFFRLTKTFTRTNLLMKYYPLRYTVSKAPIREVDNPYIDTVLGLVKSRSSLLLADVVAYNVYMTHAGMKSSCLKVPYVISISTNYRTDVHELYEALIERFPALKVREFYPFLEYLGRRQDFYLEDKGRRYMLLQVYDETSHCIPYRVDTQTGFKVTTTQVTFYYLLLTRLKMLADYHATKKGQIIEKVEVRERMIMNMIKAREAYIKKRGIGTIFTVGSMFEEFVIDCEGTSLTELRRKALRINKRSEKKMPLRYRYTPEKKSAGLDDIRFDDFMGTEIKKKNNMTLQA